MTLPTYYRSTDASAPVLTGTVGSAIAVLDACLRTGYGSQSAAGGGWTKPFTGTNLAAFRPPAGEQLYLSVDDSNAQFLKLNGYETLSAVQTGTGLFPTAVQLANCALPKSTTADSTARPWLLAADDRSFYLFTYPAATVFGNAANTDGAMFFGPMKSYKSGDAFSTSVIAQGVNTVGGVNSHFGDAGAASFSAQAGHYTARQMTQSGSSVQTALEMAGLTNAATPGFMGSITGAPAYPDPVTGSLNLVPIILSEGSGVNRGELPGACAAFHSSSPFNHFDTVAGGGDYAGVNFLVLNTWSAGNPCRLFLKTNASWF